MRRFLAFAALALFAGLASAAITLQDDFEYSVTRSQTGKTAAFNTGGGWGTIKSEPEQSGACGYIYTTTSIPGFSGSFPGTSSSRVLAMEFLPATLNCDVGGGWLQTDVYLQIGGESASQSTVPPNLWVQFWIYINNYSAGGQATTWGSQGSKWLYPCIDGSGTCTGGNISFLHVLAGNSLNPYSSVATGANIYTKLEGTGAVYSPGDPEPGGWKLGHNVASDTGLLTANTWILVKIHTDISGSQGVYQEWHKTVGGDFVQIADWRGGVTANFTWPLTSMAAERTTGQKSLKIGTTWNTTDGWIYLDDFVIASTEGDLPTYGSLLPGPGNVRWRPRASWDVFMILAGLQ